MITKSQEISRRILEKATAIAADGSCSLPFAMPAAIDHVCGEGSYARLVSELYDELRAA